MSDLYEIEIHCADRQRADTVWQELASWQHIFGGTTTMVSHVMAKWQPDEDEHALFDNMTKVLDCMVEFGVVDPERETYGLKVRTS